MALKRVPVLFEFCEKLGHRSMLSMIGRCPRRPQLRNPIAISTWCHESKKFQRGHGIKLLGARLPVVNPRFMHGAATSPNADVFAYSAAQVKKALEVTHDLEGEGYVFWGGREGYTTMLNTD
jgi:xylose isomerase